MKIPLLNGRKTHVMRAGAVISILMLLAAQSCSGDQPHQQRARFMSGQHVGNGGDPVEQLFEGARLDAMNAVKAFDPQRVALPGAADDYGDVVTFLSQPWPPSQINAAPIFRLLRADVLNSRHIYLEDLNQSQPGQPTCGRTNMTSGDLLGSDIVFSLKLCRSLLEVENGRRQAIELLLHEASHHFGLTEAAQENLAVRVGVFLAANAAALRVEWQPKVEPLSRLNEPPPRLFPQLSLSGMAPKQTTVFFFGGCRAVDIPTPTRCNRFLKDAYLHDLSTGQWKTLATAPVSERAFAASGFLSAPGQRQASAHVVWGGCSGKTGACEEFKGDGALYDPQADRWATLPKSPLTARSHPLFAELNRRRGGDDRALFVWGGKDATGSLGNGALLWLSPAAADADETAAARWKALNPPAGVDISPRFDSGVAAQGSRVYVWGGCARQGLFRCAEPLSDGFLYDAATDTWELMPPVPFHFEPRSRLTATVLQEHLVLFGGEGSLGALADGAVFDLKQRTWQPLPQLANEESRAAHLAIGLSNEILFAGGEILPNQPAKKPLRLRQAANGFFFWDVSLPAVDSGDSGAYVGLMRRGASLAAPGQGWQGQPLSSFAIAAGGLDQRDQLTPAAVRISSPARPTEELRP